MHKLFVCQMMTLPLIQQAVFLITCLKVLLKIKRKNDRAIKRQHTMK